jgi:hypothetical protein
MRQRSRESWFEASLGKLFTRQYLENTQHMGIEGGEREGAEWVVREGEGAVGRNEPILVCTYE